MDIASRYHVGDDVVVDALGSNFGSCVRLTDIPEVSSFDGDYNCDAVNGCEDLERNGSVPIKKTMEKSATFPSPGKMLSCEASSNEEDAVAERLEPLQSEQLSRTMSLPLVSALKGSRAKEGAEPRKLTVTWAPDVYDPIPNSLSHAVAVGTKQKSSRRYKDKGSNNYKKNGKKGQKGNSSRGGAGKDKKQFRRHAGRYAKSYKTSDAADEDDADAGSPDFRGGFLEKSAGDDVDVGSPDYCGSSFLKRSASKFLYPVAEAL